MAWSIYSAIDHFF